MTHVVWKYTLMPFHSTLQIPFGAKVLTVGVQDGEVRLWVEADPTRADEERRFLTVPTGIEVDLHNTTYVGTFFLDDLVFHVYEKQ